MTALVNKVNNNKIIQILLINFLSFQCDDHIRSYFIISMWLADRTFIQKASLNFYHTTIYLQIIHKIHISKYIKKIKSHLHNIKINKNKDIIKYVLKN